MLNRQKIKDASCVEHIFLEGGGESGSCWFRGGPPQNARVENETYNPSNRRAGKRAAFIRYGSYRYEPAVPVNSRGGGGGAVASPAPTLHCGNPPSSRPSRTAEIGRPLFLAVATMRGRILFNGGCENSLEKYFPIRRNDKISATFSVDRTTKDCGDQKPDVHHMRTDPLLL